MKNQSNTCKFVFVNLDNYLLVQESDWWHLELHNTFTPTCFEAAILTVTMEKSLTSAH